MQAPTILPALQFHQVKLFDLELDSKKENALILRTEATQEPVDLMRDVRALMIGNWTIRHETLPGFILEQVDQILATTPEPEEREVKLAELRVAEVDAPKKDKRASFLDDLREAAFYLNRAIETIEADIGDDDNQTEFDHV